MWMWILIGLSIITKVHGFSDRDFPQSCNNLSPQHPTVSGPDFTAQTTAAPFVVEFESTNPEEPITVVLRRNESTQFRGFLMEAREATNSSATIGTFILLDSSMTRLMTCNGLAGSAVRQSNNQRKSLIRVNWTAPEINQDIVFRATFVQEFGVFWENVTATFRLSTTTPETSTTTNTPTLRSTTTTPEQSTTTNTLALVTATNAPEQSTTTNTLALVIATNAPVQSNTTIILAPSTTTNTSAPSTATNAPVQSNTTIILAPGTTTNTSASTTANNTSEPSFETVLRSRIIQEMLQCQIIKEILQMQVVQQLVHSNTSNTTNTTTAITTNIILCQEVHQAFQSHILQLPNTATSTDTTAITILAIGMLVWFEYKI